MVSKRKTGLDLVRCFAILFVLSVHFFHNTSFYSTPILDENMYLQIFLRMAFLICVPLFIILTGYLQINKTPSKEYFKKIIPIIVIYVVYSLLAIFVRKYYFQEKHSPLDWFAMILNFKANDYSWYINMYIGLFLLSPFLNILYKNIGTKKERLMLIAVLLFISAVPNFLNLKLRGILFFPNFWVGIYPITYYFIGNFIREYQVKINKIYGLGALLLVNFIEMFIEIHYANGGTFKAMSGYYSSLIVAAHAVIFFLIFYNIEIKANTIVKSISLISILSLDIYLASNVTDRFVYKYVFSHVFETQQQVLYYIVPIVVINFLFAFVISYVRYKIIRVR